MRRTALLLASTALAVLLVSGVMLVRVEKPAQAAFPGKNGKIAFSTPIVPPTGWAYSEIFVMNPDGKGIKRLTFNTSSPNQGSFAPAWSADGSKIAFARSAPNFNANIYAMNADGSRQTQLTDNPEYEYDPAWSPDGTKIAFVRVVPMPECGEGCVNDKLFIMDAAGGGEVELLPNPPITLYEKNFPEWSPDGSKIAFVGSGVGGSQVYTVNVDGSGFTPITTGPGTRDHISWSPDGSKILFSKYDGSNYDLFVRNVNGTGTKRLTTTSVNEVRAVWSPDGTKIVFNRPRDGEPDHGEKDLWRMNADGSRQTKIRNTISESGPDWQPLP